MEGNGAGGSSSISVSLWLPSPLLPCLLIFPAKAAQCLRGIAPELAMISFSTVIIDARQQFLHFRLQELHNLAAHPFLAFCYDQFSKTFSFGDQSA